MFAALLSCCALAAAAPPSAAEAHTFAVSLARQGPRPAGSSAERAAHQRVAARFRAVGLRVGYERFTVPGKGPSRDVIGIRDAPGDCLVIAMAHTDSDPPAPGADDNASGVGTLVALARALATGPAPACDVWLVATGAEERGVHRAAGPSRGDGAREPAQARRAAGGREARALARRGRPRLEVRPALDGDRPAGERGAAHHRRLQRRRQVGARPAGEGNSDHRELARAGAPAAKLGVVDEPCRHTACDTPDRLERGAFTKVLKIVWPLLRTWD